MKGRRFEETFAPEYNISCACSQTDFSDQTVGETFLKTSTPILYYSIVKAAKSGFGLRRPQIFGHFAPTCSSGNRQIEPSAR